MWSNNTVFASKFRSRFDANRLRSFLANFRSRGVARALYTRIRNLSHDDKPGCFGLNGLHHPSDWDRLTTKCITKCQRLADEIRTENDPRDIPILRKFDELSNELCIVLDAAQLCQTVHANRNFRKSAEDAYLSVSNLVQHLNADFGLYKPLVKLADVVKTDNLAAGKHFSTEDIEMLESLVVDFEKGGITLPLMEKNRLIELQDTINRNGFEFVSNANARHTVLVPGMSKNDIPKPFRFPLEAQTNSDGQLSLKICENSLHHLLYSVPNSKHRESLYRAAHGGFAVNGLPLLDELLAARHELSQILGKESYAALQFEKRLATSPDDVEKFLFDLSKLIAPKVEKELKSLQPFAEGHYSDKNKLMVWDHSFHTRRFAASTSSTNVRDISDYLPLRAVLDGISMVMAETFGVVLREENTTEAEMWDHCVRKVRVEDECGELYGHIFFDLEPRASKSSIASHYAIRCGRDLGVKKSYQTPVAALVCSFENRCRVSGEQLLSFREYQTLWHEFGHAMHTILSRTKYQHLSGTRVPTDVVEIPSHLFENFARDPRVLARVARHRHTGDALPTRTIAEVCARDRTFSVIDLQRQVMMSVMDLKFHGRNPPIGESMKMYYEVEKLCAPFPAVKDVASYTSFQHFVNYGAGYYSYLFGEIISAQLWNDLGFRDNPFDRDAGAILQKQYLSQGASQSPAKLLQGLLRKHPNCDSFLQACMGMECGAGELKLPV